MGPPHLHSCRLALRVRHDEHSILDPGFRHYWFRGAGLSALVNSGFIARFGCGCFGTLVGLPAGIPSPALGGRGRDLSRLMVLIALSTVCIWLLKSLIWVSTRNSRAISRSFTSLTGRISKKFWIFQKSHNNTQMARVCAGSAVFS